MTSHDRMVLAGLEHGCRQFQWMRTFEPSGVSLVGMMAALTDSHPGFIHGVMLAAAMHRDRIRQTIALREEARAADRHLELVA